MIHVEPAPPAHPVAERVTVVMNPQSRKKNEHYHVEIWETAADLRCMLMVWPMQREGWFARVLHRFADNLDWWEAAWPNRTLLEPLLDADVPLEPMALLMLALGLAAKQPDESGLATDALMAAIDDGRLDACKLGAMLAFLAPMIKCSRLARTLSQAARSSPLHLQVVAQIIQGAMRGDPAQAPRDVQALLELLKESLLELGASVSDADARGYLEKIKTGGKTGRLIRELLTLNDKPEPLNRRQALLRALEHRVSRAECWCRRVESFLGPPEFFKTVQSYRYGPSPRQTSEPWRKQSVSSVIAPLSNRTNKQRLSFGFGSVTGAALTCGGSERRASSSSPRRRPARAPNRRRLGDRR